MRVIRKNKAFSLDQDIIRDFQGCSIALTKVALQIVNDKNPMPINVHTSPTSEQKITRPLSLDGNSVQFSFTKRLESHQIFQRRFRSRETYGTIPAASCEIGAAIDMSATEMNSAVLLSENGGYKCELTSSQGTEERMRF